MFCDASFAFFTVLTSQRFSAHTVHTEMRLVELPCLEELFDDASLLIAAAWFGYVSWVFKHALEIKVCRCNVTDDE